CDDPLSRAGRPGRHTLLDSRPTTGSDSDRGCLCNHWYFKWPDQVDCGASSSLSIFSRDNPGERWQQFSQWSCHVLRGILGITLFFWSNPLQGKTLVAYRTVDYFCAVCCACRSF